MIKKINFNSLLAKWSYIGLLVSVVFLSACDVPLVRQYDGEIKKNDDIAILLHKPEMGWRLSSIDGEAIVMGITTWSGSAGVEEIHLLPGKRILFGELRIKGKQAFFNLEFNFKAGKKYQLDYKLLDEVVSNRVVIFVKYAENNIDKNFDDSIYSDDSSSLY